MDDRYVKYQIQSTGEIKEVLIGEVQYLFLHVPKTGGTYVAKNNDALSPIFDLNHSVLVKMPYEGNLGYPPQPGYSPSMRKDVELVTKPHRLCFATVRNPFDWLVSYFYHSSASSHYDYELSQKGFDYLVKSILNRENGWPSRKLLYFAFFSYEGYFFVNRLIHQEHLDFELEEFANESVDLFYKKQDNRPRQSLGRNLDYRLYYTTDLVDLVSKVWSRDLFLFGYDFEHGKVNGFFDKKISSTQKADVSYIWDLDTLYIDGKVIT